MLQKEESLHCTMPHTNATSSRNKENMHWMQHRHHWIPSLDATPASLDTRSCQSNADTKACRRQIASSDLLLVLGSEGSSNSLCKKLCSHTAKPIQKIKLRYRDTHHYQILIRCHPDTIAVFHFLQFFFLYLDHSALVFASLLGHELFDFLCFL